MAPMLAGARVRAAQRTGVELVVPNPSGARGFYILDWAGARALCNPTLHDTMLFRRFSHLATVDPAGIRDAALDVALAGHAGQEASAAAGTAITRDRSRRLLAHFLLLRGLLDQLDPNGQTAMPSTSAPRIADIERLATAALHRIAPSLGRSAAQLADNLQVIAGLFAPVGAAGDREARIPGLLSRLKKTRTGLSRWLDADPGNDIGGLGQAIAAAMRRACDSGDTVLAATRQALADPMALLKRWIVDEAGVQALASRCDWLLDGWEHVALLWLWAKPGASRRAALLEMAPLIPVLPHEVMTWTGIPIPAEAMEQTCRVTSREDTWRTGGSAFALIERNEKLRAMSI
jgi:hypothetical protein